MNLSIVIPTYNFICTSLVKDLYDQCCHCAEVKDFEIIVADDGSTDDAVKIANRKINTLPYCDYRESDKNIGRSRILHNTVLTTQYSWVMIMDSDAKVCSENFINTYIKSTNQNTDVICGGIQTSCEYLTTKNTLRYKYESHAESIRMLDYRKKHPYRFFSSFNILVKRTVFEKINFDDKLEQYGYEDTLFGMDMKRNNLSILHIKNPLIHTGIDDNSSYVKKTEQAIENLVILKNDIGENSPLYQYYLKFQKLHLLWIIKLWHKLFASVEKMNLLSKHPSLFFFNLYKLGYFSTINK